MRLAPVLALLLASPMAAQEKLPPIRPLGAVTAKAEVPLVSPMLTLRPLPSGKVLVNDPMARKVVLLDGSLANPVVVADSTAATANAYSGRFAGMFAYKGDSTLFVDAQSLSMLVLDGEGKVARVMSIPRPDDAMSFSGVMGAPALDAGGRLVYRASPRFNFRSAPGAPMAPPEFPDSAAITRVDLASRAVDTVGWIKVPKVQMQMNRSDDGRITMTSTVNPLPVTDDWTVLSDGTIAIVRGGDYRVDFIDPDGSHRASGKVPFEWRRLTDEQKVAFIDSAKVARERMMEQARANPQGAPGMASPGGGPAMGGGMVVTMRMGGEGAPPPRRAAGDSARRGDSTRTQVNMPQVTFVAPSELPDYRPPFFQGGLRADHQGNLWVRTTKLLPGNSTVYDVIDRTGTLVDRVQVPANRQIAGFGADGSVYLTGRDGTKTVLERATVK